jgi:hypothetical protein
VRKDRFYRRMEFSRKKKVAVDHQFLYVVAPETFRHAFVVSKNSRSRLYDDLNGLNNLNYDSTLNDEEGTERVNRGKPTSMLVPC